MIARQNWMPSQILSIWVCQKVPNCELISDNHLLWNVSIVIIISPSWCRAAWAADDFALLWQSRLLPRHCLLNSTLRWLRFSPLCSGLDFLHCVTTVPTGSAQDCHQQCVCKLQKFYNWLWLRNCLLNSAPPPLLHSSTDAVCDTVKCSWDTKVVFK